MEALNLYTYQINSELFNFGEYLAKRIVEKMGYFPILFGNVTPPINHIKSLLFSIGGLVNRYYCSNLQRQVERIYVWGSGMDCQYSEDNLLDPETLEMCFEFRMVRGKLTREAYHLPESILLGDIGFLASCFFDVPPRQDGKIVQIPFYSDTGIPVAPGVTKVISSLIKKDTFGSFESNFQEVLNNIATAEFVLTGSMHSAIVAHSFGTPWALCHKANTDVSKEWKWHDVFSTLGLEPDDFKVCSTLEEAVCWWKDVSRKIQPITKEYQQKILGAFPYECL